MAWHMEYYPGRDVAAFGLDVSVGGPVLSIPELCCAAVAVGWDSPM
eukprot:COSAG01_NODE_9148_length_2537_cov_1.123462_2_plen_46_part_00